MELNVIWFILIAVLFIVFFILEGFDYGVGIVSHFITKEPEDRYKLLSTLGPVWDSNQVWLLTAGGAMFAAFPNWYATMFSSYYLALFLMIFALIARGLGLEWRKKVEVENIPKAQIMVFIGSFISILLWGVVLGNSLTGIPINEDMSYGGGFFNLLGPHALLGGILAVSFSMGHGSIYLMLKAPIKFIEESKKYAFNFSSLTLVLGLAFIIYSYIRVSNLDSLERLPWILIGLSIIFMLATPILIKAQKVLLAFISSSLTAAMSVIILFTSIFPNTFLSSTSKDYHLTIENSASSDLTLKIMLIVVLIFLPIIISYKIWAYSIFRKRLDDNSTDFYL